MKGSAVRLRVYKTDLYQDKEERESERKLISNAFQALTKIPSHPNILGVRDFFETEDGDIVLVTEDLAARSLNQQIERKPIV